jgi:hypothetical protein
VVSVMDPYGRILDFLDRTMCVTCFTIRNTSYCPQSTGIVLIINREYLVSLYSSTAMFSVRYELGH